MYLIHVYWKYNLIREYNLQLCKTYISYQYYNFVLDWGIANKIILS